MNSVWGGGGEFGQPSWTRLVGRSGDRPTTAVWRGGGEFGQRSWTRLVGRSGDHPTTAVWGGGGEFGQPSWKRVSVWWAGRETGPQQPVVGGLPTAPRDR